MEEPRERIRIEKQEKGFLLYRGAHGGKGARKRIGYLGVAGVFLLLMSPAAVPIGFAYFGPLTWGLWGLGANAVGAAMLYVWAEVYEVKDGEGIKRWAVIYGALSSVIIGSILLTRWLIGT